MELLDLGSVILPFILLFFVYHIEKTLIKIKKKMQTQPTDKE